jgi:hypothetical protein
VAVRRAGSQVVRPAHTVGLLLVGQHLSLGVPGVEENADQAMAVNFFNRLIVSGPHGLVLEFQTRAERTYERTVCAETWTEHLPFSFTALQEITPIFPKNDLPFEPYEIAEWPVKQLSPRRAEVRYQFETRAVDLSPALKRLSRKLPRLTFRLMTLCLDDGDVETWEIRAGKMRFRRVSARRHEFHWDAARRKFHLEERDVYENDDATRFAELRICQEALGSWEKQNGRPRRLDWTRGLVFMKLEDERLIAMASLAQAIGPDTEKPTPKRAVKQAGSRAAKRRARS